MLICRKKAIACKKAIELLCSTYSWLKKIYFSRDDIDAYIKIDKLSSLNLFL